MVFHPLIRSRLLIACFLALFIIISITSFYRDSETFRSAYQHVQPSSASKTHPIRQLHLDAVRQHERLLKRQSQSLAQATAEYKRRYKVDPPSGFEIWYGFATNLNATIIDDYDTVFKQTQPFRRFRESSCDLSDIDGDLLWKHRLTRLCVRDGKHELSGFAESWYHNTLISMIAPFIHLVPDVCVLINTLDEPRVVLPYSQIESLKKTAETAQKCTSPTFLDLSKQLAWPELILPCHVDSAARGGDEHNGNHGKVSLGFVKEPEIETDLCLRAESLNHGLLLSPASLEITHSSLPILSPSKLSTFQDILFPDVWRFSHIQTQISAAVSKLTPDETTWDDKSNKVYWRGSTTGGYATDDRWRRFQRQELVRFLDTDSQVPILKQVDGKWNAENASISSIRDATTDIKFTQVIQCDESICDEQKDTFHLSERESLQEAWKNRYVLDMDGNGLSGRFYDLLESNSAVMKRALFREWHDERLQPWLHYIPISNSLDDVGEVIRFFTGDGLDIGAEIARQGRSWASEALRLEDMQVYLFRVLLELSRRH